MKRSLVVLSTVWVGLSVTSATAQGLSCNFYLWDVCFLTGRGVRVTTAIPVDFVITEIELANGAHLTSYEGIGLADPNGSGGPVQLRAYDLGGIPVRVYAGAERTQRGQYFSLRYGTRGNQVFGWFSTAEEHGSIVTFLKTFLPCQRGQTSVACTSEPIFKEGADVIASLRSGLN